MLSIRVGLLWNNFNNIISVYFCNPNPKAMRWNEKTPRRRSRCLIRPETMNLDF